MRHSLRALAGLFIIAGLAACTDTRSISTPIPPGMHAGRIALNPVFEPTAKAAVASLGDFGLSFDHVRVAIRKAADTTKVVLDTTVAFTSSSGTLTLDLTVPVDNDNEVFNALVQYLGSSGAIFAGSVNVQSYAPGAAPPEGNSLVLKFVGPGAKLKTFSVTPKPVNLVGTQTVPLTVAATDSSGAAITGIPIIFTSSDTTIAKATAVGTTVTAQSFGKRGSARLVATTPIGISDTLTAVVTLPPAAIVIVSGGSQTGTVGTTLPNPVVVQVNASDNVGIAGATVTFTAPTGASVGTATATTDANGRASSTLTLSTTAGAQNFTATANGLTVNIPETATAAVATFDHFDLTRADGTTLSGITIGTGVPLAVKVTARDKAGNAITGYTGSPVMRVNNSRFSGDTVVTAPAAVAGVSTVNLTFSQISSNAYITATGTFGQVTLTTASLAFGVVQGPASRLSAVGVGEVVVNDFDSTPSSYPQLQVTDGAGNPIANATVRFSLDAIPSASISPQCRTTLATATTDANGLITFNASTLQYSPGADYPSSCILRATATVDGSATGTPLTGSPLLIALVIRPLGSGTSTWTGKAHDKSWTNPGNWVGAVPTTSTSVFLPWATASLTATSPRLTTAAGVFAIEIEDGAVLDLNTQTLSVGGDIQGHTVGTISNGTVATAPGNGGQLSGTLPNFACTNSAHDLAGIVVVTGDLTNSGCQINLDGSKLGIAGNYTQSGGGLLGLTNASDIFVVTGNAQFGGGNEANLMTAGAMAFGGNFAQSGTGATFASAGTSVTIAPLVNATQPQLINFTDPTNSFFRRLNVSVSTAAGVNFQTQVGIKDSLDVIGSGALTFGGGFTAQQNGGLAFHATALILTINGNINARSLTFVTGSSTTLNGTMNVQMANGVIRFRSGSTVTVNATVSAFSAASCIIESGATINGPNAAAFTGTGRCTMQTF
ncbi:MAG TPA: hypothetical protein VGM82_22520 [Gemmatimonadaceae bacterium]|jgi:adhesin/invasin